MRSTYSCRNTQTIQDQKVYTDRQDELFVEYESMKQQLNDLSNIKQSQTLRRLNISRFLDELRGCDELLDTFDEDLWYSTVERVVVYDKSNVVMQFKSGIITYHKVHIQY